jgi:hypothetical protein
MPETGFEIHFLDSFRADTAVIPEVIDHLIADLRAAGYPQDEIDEVVLSWMKQSPMRYRKQSASSRTLSLRGFRAA